MIPNDLDGIFEQIISLEKEINDLKDKKDSLQEQALNLVDSDVNSQLSLNDYGCGTATIETDGFKVKAVVSKRVEWDNEKLHKIYKSIEASGQAPELYMRAEYKVSEAAFKTWPANVQEAFVDARTVKQSKPSLKIERKEK